ncbi:Beta-galactosidase 8 [Camellia lanceoleosa]|uniref:Beta-galactosidase 8 n=1 Tax=Camellia lanceoleosa TaxID=1840588 RepID=A0ACC0I5Y3_9ERIC|nr:Beta-galactosidase 8 [Camellia lanceoleosa]
MDEVEDLTVDDANGYSRVDTDTVHGVAVGIDVNTTCEEKRRGASPGVCCRALVWDGSDSGVQVNVRKFKIAEDMFWKDGKPFQIIGGDLHYFRVLPELAMGVALLVRTMRVSDSGTIVESSNGLVSCGGVGVNLHSTLSEGHEYWEDRLLRAKALGLNTIQIYVPWNLHEPRKGQLVFEGIADIVSFLKLCQKLDLLVMLRPGPYICAEWDLGGFPAWLLAIEPALTLRSSDPAFLDLVDKWWGILLPLVAPLLYDNGGPIIMVQIENEYGSYGDDKVYLHHLVTVARGHLGDDTILYTTDGGSRETLEKGTIHGDAVFSAVDFMTGDEPWPIFKLQKEFNALGKSPPLSAEFYTGWLTHWGENIAILHWLMAHGGTNFGFYSGANTGANESDYKPDLTSYDYVRKIDLDAPIQETGDVDNAKFKALRSVIDKYSETSLPSVPSNNEKTGYGRIQLQKTAFLFDTLNIKDAVGVAEFESPISMESAGQMFGFSLYVSEYTANDNGNILFIPEVHDRAQVFISCPSKDDARRSTYIGKIERWSNRPLSLPYTDCPSDIRLFILVENMGRVNYGSFIFDRKVLDTIVFVCKSARASSNEGLEIVETCSVQLKGGLSRRKMHLGGELLDLVEGESKCIWGILSSVYLDGKILKRWKMFSVPFQNLNEKQKVNPIIEIAYSEIFMSTAHKKLKDRSDNSSKEPAFYAGYFTVDKTSQLKDTFISFRGWGKGIAFVNEFNIGRYWPSFGPQCNLYVPAPILQNGKNVVVILELESPHPELVVSSVDQPDFTCGPSGSRVHQL